MRIGILGLLHESNTFSSQPTTLERFQQDCLLAGPPVRDRWLGTHHEIGGFLEELARQSAAKPIEVVPLFTARALPSGTVTRACFEELVERLIAQVRAAGPLDGLLAAPHGATVSEQHPDADGYWLEALRAEVGGVTPIVATLDAHANLSPQMVRSVDALIAYRTNPHLDQKQRGIEAAALLIRTIEGAVRPTMAAAFPPLIISIDRQCTDEPHLRPLYETANEQLSAQGVLSNSIVLGFPYADVAELGSATVVVTDAAPELAQTLADRLAQQMWDSRDAYRPRLVSIDAALKSAAAHPGRTCLLDMGDNVGGGSSADGTALVAALLHRKIGPSFVCLFDPEAVAQCRTAGIGSQLSLRVGGKTDVLHGEPVAINAVVRSLSEGRFSESEARHGGIRDFDQGSTAVVQHDQLTVMLTSRRMVPFSLNQLRSCDLEPGDFRVLVAKGVNAPLAAYREVCDQTIRVNTPGSTTADLRQLEFHHRRRPLFPFEDATA